MRTPDEETSSGDGGGSLAGGFGETHDDAASTDLATDTTDEFSETEDGGADDPFAEPTSTSGDYSEDSYGTGSTEEFDPYATDSTATELDSGLEAEDPTFVADDPGDVATDTDLDFNGDGLVDDVDVVEGATALFSFGFEHAQEADHDGGDMSQLQGHDSHHDGGGFFDS
jgi:hypothetical protein